MERKRSPMTHQKIMAHFKENDPWQKQRPKKKKELNKAKKPANQEESKDEPPVQVKKKPCAGVNLAAMTPVNVVEQKDLFFSNNCNLNPQFEYSNYAAT